MSLPVSSLLVYKHFRHCKNAEIRLQRFAQKFPCMQKTWKFHCKTNGVKQEYLLPQYVIIIIKENALCTDAFCPTQWLCVQNAKFLTLFKKPQPQLRLSITLYAQKVVCRLTAVFSTLQSTLRRKGRFPLHNDKIRLSKGYCFVQTATNAKLCNEKPQSKALKPFAERCLNVALFQ